MRTKPEPVRRVWIVYSLDRDLQNHQILGVFSNRGVAHDFRRLMHNYDYKVHVDSYTVDKASYMVGGVKCFRLELNWHTGEEIRYIEETDAREFPFHSGGVIREGFPLLYVTVMAEGLTEARKFAKELYEDWAKRTLYRWEEEKGWVRG